MAWKLENRLDLTLEHFTQIALTLLTSESDGKHRYFESMSSGKRRPLGTRRIIIILSPSILWISSGGR